MSVQSPLDAIAPGIKVAAQVRPEASDADLQLVARMGVAHAVLWTGAENANYEYYASRRERFEKAGVSIYGFGSSSVHNVDAIVLNLPNRDEKVAEYKRHIRALGKAGIPYTTYAHMANSVWSTEREETRAGASARAFNTDTASTALTHDREYSEQEIWDNFTSFITEVAPVAEEAGVMIGMHPDDPPGIALGGVPRCILSNFEGYVRAVEIADSPNVGLCLCVGCWLEGGDAMGKSVVDAIHYFGERRKIFKVHFRNVDRPLPHFVETFLDNGYMDMSTVMNALRDVDFNGVVIPDHIPAMADDGRIGTAYTIGYMNALVERANAEAG
ncbi:TIM barrel protein [Candidatus Poribacteria bacterium]|jgi:mannonate dehydratase|nr:TIM barrel protein [Candidatus Poribacteria bacterium]MBT5532615.1 TIM barrel protein [Candidatus Poribacteria bacterium]MBT5710895.1 TIM barrel protein [Candidatus Poribacteria bacterium]MBT7095950.1 TIM barrel protein [Candidatus Poribacteria bacterium]MBT7806269.1 TIM barrel protein [Candidatus Poribacteria bacterium]